MIIADVVALFANPARAMQEKRKSQRQPISRYAKLQLPGGSLPRDCLVTDMSEGGVRLHVEGVDVPEQFAVLLSIGGGKPELRHCRVVWKLGHEVGALEVTEGLQGIRSSGLLSGSQQAIAPFKIRST
jgi:hypothetical protein